MGACASKFTVLKNASTAPPPAVKYEVEAKEVNLVEEVAVEKDDSPLVEDDASRRQSLGHLLQEVKSGEEKKSSAESDGKASENLKHDDAVEVKREAVSDAPAQDEGAKAPIADTLKSDCAEEEVQMEAEKVEDKPAETVKLETAEKPQDDKDVTDKEPEILEPGKTEASEVKKIEEAEEEKPAVEKLEISERTPETPVTERTGEHNPASDAEKKETDEKSTEIIKVETLEEKPEVTEEQKEAEEKDSEEKPCEISEKKPESPVMEKAADADKSVIVEKPAENTGNETADKVEDKHILEPQTTENILDNKTPDSCSEEQRPVSDAEKPKV